MAEEESFGALFHNVVFTIMPSDDLEDDEKTEVLAALESNGGRYVPLRSSDQQIDELDNITHIISTTIEFPQYALTVERGISTVKPSWVAHSARKSKQASARQHSPDPSQYFHNVVVTCADLPEGDAEAITAGVMALGGQFSHPLTKLVTHVVTMSLDHPKCKAIKDKGHKCKLVLPHWFDDCFRLGKKISERPYEFPDPELLRRNNKPHVKAYPSPDLEGAVSPSPTKVPGGSPPPSPSESRKNLNALMCKDIFLDNDLELSDNLKETINRLIVYAGGVVVSKVDEADIYIGYFRDGANYIAASRAGKEVANLAWLYHVINQNKYTTPLKRLFHYPVPRNGVPGFKDMKISLSNYAGDSRNYIENLIRICGAEYTKTMKQDNTHLVTAHKNGEKCEAASEWNIKVVNHLWLEESYAKCAIQSCTNDKYTTFPTRTNLGEVTGRTGLDMASVEKQFFPKARSPQKKPAEKPSPRKTVPTSNVLAEGVTMQEDDVGVPTTIAEAEEMDVDPAEPMTVKKPRGRTPRSAAATPRVASARENATPAITSTGRASKSKALNSIHDSAEDIALYQKELKRKGGVTHGRERRASVAEMSSPAPATRNSRKRPSEEYEVTAQGSDLSDGETQDSRAKQNKKAKHSVSSTLPPVQYRMMVTGDDRWTNNAKKEAADKAILRGLGVLLTQDPAHVDILVAPKILRTKKFVSALACAPLVVDTSFLEYALSKKKLQDNPPILKDKDNEDRLGFTLSESLKLAKRNKRKLFANWAICVTKDVNGGFDTYKEIISLNGGETMMYQGRQKLSLAKPTNQAGNEFDYVYLVSGKSEAEMKLWKKFRENASSQGVEAKIVSSDWVLNAAMSQKITLSEKWVLDEEDEMGQCEI
ncbi:BRCT-containing protein 1 [Fulvia fulva]|uniref:BRCT-containing protein 1 n=1 Tax=Passalora fulva TaxID=5499 RepID=A0A9Q8L6U8_PASFU|nr:BRCT-containing protein 1 [Fulvia fulva]KAK4634623.1 BRCT-containing protein 1 [Fulvia fulva]KAK4636712.1 BRCT-containing protein 1 [Fulvia fulva]UJO11947.1 BRCT-containing protein 1 [Fulvia fulva]WPV09268.1 BRCT-containing protein 1 [Fulvia fulva]WPV24296.1 BRCT-containing protein 1 [Fulvia fulva]